MSRKRVYHWRGVDQFDQIRKSEIIATSPSEAKQQLLHNQIVPLTIKKGSLLKQTDFKIYDLLIITHQIVTMLKSGLPLVTVLTIMVDEQTNLLWRTLLKQIRNDINNGHSFYEALHQFPMTFPAMYRQTVSAGEQTGQLLYCLQFIVKDLEKTLHLRNKIKKSLRYPMLLGIVTMIAAVIVFCFLLPQFKQIYATFEADLPFFSNAMFCFGDHLRQHFLSILFFSSILFLSFYLLIYRKYPHQLQKWLLSTPKLGQLLKNKYLYFLFRHLSLTYKAALPLIKGLELASNHINSSVYIQALTAISTKIKRGHSFSSTLKDNSLFPPICRQCIRTGEESGNLDQMLEQLANYYQQQTDQSIDKLAAKIEPILLLILCLVIGSFAFTLYLPIIHLGEVML